MKGSQNDALERFVLCLINIFDKIHKWHTYSDENMDDILKQLAEIKTELEKPFPTRDINKTCEDFRYYCVNISGTLNLKTG